MKYYVHVRNEEIFFNVRALNYQSAVNSVDKILDFLEWEHDFEISVEPFGDFPDFQLRVNQKGQLKGAFYDSIYARAVYEKYLEGVS